ncbi:MAG: DUF4199 domain-containing protein [Bacteroidales bacterium]|jgi:hypothetical protein|nr:DUF4199 domain-containing protein [Bacteroidales bacterium]
MEGKAKKIFINGLILSLPLILMSVLSYAFGLAENKFFGYLTIILLVVAIFLVQRNFRNSYLNGYGSYGQLFGNTLLMILISLFVHGIFIYIFYKFIAPEQINIILENAKAILYQNDMLSDDQIEAAYEMQKKMVTPLFLSISSAFSYLIWGIITNLITSAINKKNKDPFTDAMKEIADNE